MIKEFKNKMHNNNYKKIIFVSMSLCVRVCETFHIIYINTKNHLGKRVLLFILLRDKYTRKTVERNEGKDEFVFFKRQNRIKKII